ncbi:MAG TPA: CARDB domain-containing protein [Coriobacteriia bacterium]
MKNGRLSSPARGWRLLLIAAALGALALPLAASQAATPSSGTVSSSNLSVAWNGDYQIPTASGCSGANDSSCDRFALTIQPPSYSFQVEIKLQPFVGDWDLYVFAPSGGLAGSSGNAPGQTETVTLTNPAAGTYTVSAAPFAPAPGAPTYTASATIVPIQSGSQPPPGTEHITYSSHKPPKGMGEDAGEPSIGANTKSGNVMFQSGLEALRATFDDSTSPATASWKDVSFLTSSIVSLDPIGFMDQHTNRWFSSQLSGTTSLAALTDDDGANWIPSEGGPLNGGVDHQTIGGGPFAPPLTRDPNGALYPDAVYYCSQDLVAALCARSDDGGVTFAPAVPIYTDQCGGLHGHVKVAPDGTVYVPNKDCGGKQGVAVSTDNGLTWNVRTVPGSSPGAWDPSVAVASDGTVYFAYGDGDGHPKVAVSHDRGQTWTNIRDVGVPFSIAATAFPAAVAGDPNRAAMAFIGTSETSPGAMGDDPSWPGTWYVYVAHTYDGGDTWTTVNATPGDPVQRGTICGGGFGGCDNGTRNLLDFMDATVDKDGRVLVGFADGCIDSCITSAPGSFTAITTIAREVSGKRMFAAKDVLSAPSAPLITAKSLAGPPASNMVSWQEPDDHGSPITAYKVYRGGSLLATVGGDARNYTDTAIQAGQTYTYRLSAVNAQGEGPLSNEATPVPPPPPDDPCAEPGVRVLTDATGDSTGGDPAKDIQRLSIAEPRDIGLGKIEFLLKMASLANVPPDTTWPVVFQTPDGVDRFVRMATNAAGTVSFGYGTGTSGGALTTGTPADPASSYSADGTIRIIVPRSAINIGAGDKLTQFLVRIRVEGGAVALTPDNMPDSLARTGSYTVTGNENCAVPQPDLAITANDIGTVQQSGKNGKLVTIVVTVHNMGTADASNVPVGISIDGTQLAQPTAPNIAAGSFTRVSAQWDTKGQSGTHTITAAADPANTIAESDESNNSASKTVTVKGKNVS